MLYMYKCSITKSIYKKPFDMSLYEWEKLVNKLRCCEKIITKKMIKNEKVMGNNS